VAEGYARRQRNDPERFARIDAAHTQSSVWDAVFAVFVAKGWLA
jgi:dTMP kinase